MFIPPCDQIGYMFDLSGKIAREFGAKVGKLGRGKCRKGVEYVAGLESMDVAHSNNGY